MLRKRGDENPMRTGVPVTLRGAVRAGVLGLIIAGGGMLGGCESELTDAQYVARAKELAQKGDLRASAIELKNALRSNPNNAEARWLLGNLYLSVGDGVNAEKELRRAIELKVSPVAVALPLAKALFQQEAYRKLIDTMPIVDGISRAERTEWLVLRGRALLSLGEADKARAEIAKAVSEDPGAAQTLLGQGLLAFLSGDLRAAKEWTAKAVAKDPGLAEAWTLNGDVLFVENAQDEAIKAYTKAIESRRLNLLDYVKRAQAYLELNRLDEAKADIDHVLKLSPRSPDARFLQGALAYRQDRLEEAQGALEEVIRARPDYAMAQMYLGMTLLRRDARQQAEVYLSQAAARLPNVFEPAFALATLYVGNGDFAKAEARLQPFAAQRANDPHFLALRGDVYLRQNKVGPAVQDLGKVATLQPQSARAHQMYGLALIAAGKRDEGLQELERAVALDPKLRTADVAMISTHLRAKEYDKALEAAQRWRQREPGDAAALNAIGRIQYLRGEQQAAREAFTQASQEAPDDLFATRSLAMLDVQGGDIEAARKRVEAFIAREPDNLRALLDMAGLEASSGRVDAAADWLRKAMAAHPQAPQPRAMLATYLVERGQAEQAIALLKDPAAGNHDNDPAFLQSLAEAQLAAGQAANAAVVLERVQSLRPDSARVAYLLARAYAASGDRERARASLQRALKIEPGNVLASAALSRMFAVDGKTAEALAVLDEAQRVHPESNELQAQRGALEASFGDPKAAVATLTKVFESTPTPALAIQLARAHLRAGAMPQGIKVLEDWVAQHPGDTPVYRELSEFYVAANREADAAAMLKRVIDGGNDSPLLLNNLAWLLRKSDPKQGLAYAQRAADQAPNVPVVMDTYGVLLLDNGEVERAVKVLGEVVRLSPGSVSSRLNYARALARQGEKARAESVLKAARPSGPQADAQRAEIEKLRQEIARP